MAEKKKSQSKSTPKKDTPKKPAQEEEKSSEMQNLMESLVTQGQGEMPKFFDRTFAEIKTEQESEERERMIALMGKSRLPDYEKNIEPYATGLPLPERDMASEEKEDEGGIGESIKEDFQKALDIFPRRVRNAWNDMTGEEREAVNLAYDNEGELKDSFIASWGIPTAVGVGSVIGAMAGVASAPAIATAGVGAFAINAMIQAGAEPEELEEFDTILEPLMKYYGSKWEGIFDEDDFKEGDDEEDGYWQRVAKIMIVDSIEGFAIGGILGMGAKASIKSAAHIYKKIPKEFIRNQAGFLKLRFRETKKMAEKREFKSQVKREIKALTNNPKFLKLLRNTDELIMTSKDVRKKRDNKAWRLQLAKDRNVDKFEIKLPDTSPEIAARYAGGKHYRAYAGKKINRLMKKGGSMEPDEIKKEINQYIDAKLKYDQLDHGQAGTTRVADKAGKTTKEKVEAIQETSWDENLRVMEQGEVLTNNMEGDALLNLRVKLLEEGKMTSDIDAALKRARDVQDGMQDIPITKAGADLQMGQANANFKKQTKRLNRGLDGLFIRYNDASHKDRKRILKDIVKKKEKIEGLRKQQWEMRKDGKLMYAYSFMLKNTVDYFLSKGALLASMTGNLVSYATTASASVFKHSGFSTAIVDAGMIIPDTFKYLGHRLGTKKGWIRMWEEISGGGDVYRTQAKLDASTPAKKAANIASSFNMQLLQEMDNFFRGSSDQMASRQAFRKMVERRLRNAATEEHPAILKQIKEDFERQDKEPYAGFLDYTADYLETKKNWHDRHLMRAEMADDAPAVSRLFWYFHNVADTLRGHDIPLVRAVGQGLGLFSRVSANMSDWVGRNTAFGLLDLPSRARERLIKDKAEMAIGTMGSLALFSMSNTGKKIMGTHSRLTDSRTGGRRFGDEPGVMIGGVFMPLKNFGPLGTAVLHATAGYDTVDMLIAAGREGDAEEAAQALSRLIYYMNEDTWISGSLLPFLAMIDRQEGESAVSESMAGKVLKSAGAGLIPMRGLAERLESMSKGYRPDTGFFDAIAEMSDFVPVGPHRDGFGNPFSNNAYEKVTNQDVGFPSAVESTMLFLNPNFRMVPAPVFELNNYLVDSGAFTKSNVIKFKTKSGHILNVPVQAFQQGIVPRMRPLRREVTLRGKGTFRLTERDYHGALSILSLRKEDVERTMGRWRDIYDSYRVEYPAGQYYLDQVQEATRQKDVNAMVSAVKDKHFRGRVPDALFSDPKNGTSDFLHYMAVTPYDKLPNKMKSDINEVASVIKEEVKRVYRLGNTDISEEDIDDMSRVLARRQIIVGAFTDVREQVAAISGIAPSIVKQVIENQDL